MAQSTSESAVPEPARGREQMVIQRAAALFDEQGYHQTSMAEIAEAVGLRKPTLYHYFGSKSDILNAIHEEFIDLLIQRQLRREATALDPQQMVLEIMSDILELMQTHRGHVRVFFEHHRELAGPQHAEIERKRAEYEALVTAVLRRGVDNGTFRELDVKLATLAMFGMCNWAYQWYRVQGPLRAREIGYVFWEFLLYGIAHPGGPVTTGRASVRAG
jgi:AcrR family transcriptional regulator